MACETLSGFVLAVLKMAAACVSVVFRCFEFIITQFMTLLITLVSIIWKIASFVFVLSWHIIVETLGHVFNFFVSIPTLVSHVTIRSYETLVQLGQLGQLAFETLSGFVLAVFKMAATCVSVVFHCFEFIITQFMTLLITLVSIIWKIASFVFVLSWHIIVETLGHVFNFFVSIPTLVSHVTIRSYETLVQLGQLGQLAFETLGGFVLAVFKMAATCVSVVFHCFEFIITQFMTLLITLVSIVWKIASFVFVLSWHIIVETLGHVFNFFVSIPTLVSHVTIRSYETLVQLGQLGQLAFETLSGFVLAVFKMAATCVSVIFHCFEFIITQFMTLLITLVSIIWKIASFVFVLSWHIIVETLGHVFNFFVSIPTLVSHVTIRSYETLVQLGQLGQLAFETLSGFVLAVFKMAATCVSVIFHCFEFIITQFMTLLITLVSIIWKIASFVFVLSWHIIVETLGHVFNFFVSIPTLVSHVTIRSYETLVQLGQLGQLAFETLSVYVLAVFKMAATCVSVVFHCFEFIITQLMTLLITLVSIIWKIASFVFILSLHITVKTVETFVSLVVGISEELNTITVIFCTVSIVIVSLLLMKSVSFRKIYRHLAHKFQELTRNAEKAVEKELYITKKLLDEERATKRCTVCLDNRRTMCVRPCRHYCLCEICEKKLTTRKCPICNNPIEDVEKIYDV